MNREPQKLRRGHEEILEDGLGAVELK